MRADYAGQQIAKHISKRWPQDKSEIYKALQLGLNKAWKEGKWFGMTRELFVPKRCHSSGDYIISPYEFPILLAINSDCKAQLIRGKDFMFHRNGDGAITNSPSCRWNRDVFDIGVVPVIWNNKINLNSGVRIGIRPLGKPAVGEKVYINGIYTDNKRIYTYKNVAGGLDNCKCTIQTNGIQTSEGIELSVIDGFNYICDIEFADVTSISKSITRNPIEVIALTLDNKAYPIAELQPNQLESKYRKYLIPRGCGECIHGLFKIREQEQLMDSSELIISDEESLICLAKTIDLMYSKNQPNEGAAFFAQAITNLNKHKAESDSPDHFPVQVHMIGEESIPDIFRHHS